MQIQQGHQSMKPREMSLRSRNLDINILIMKSIAFTTILCATLKAGGLENYYVLRIVLML